MFGQGLPIKYILVSDCIISEERKAPHTEMVPTNNTLFIRSIFMIIIASYIVGLGNRISTVCESVHKLID